MEILKLNLLFLIFQGNRRESLLREILGKRIISFDFRNDNEIFYGSLEYFFGKTRLSSFKEWDLDFQPTVDDIIVVNIPWDYILNLKIPLPAVKNKKEIDKLLLLEITQNLGIQPEQIYYDYLITSNNIANVFVVKKEELQNYFQNLYAKKIPEPDILYPDFFKESILLSRFPGYSMQLFINKKYSGMLVFNDSDLIEVRYSDLSLKNFDEVLLDEFGYSIYELEYIDDETLIKDVKAFLMNFFSDFLSLIEREVFITINSMEEKIGLENIQTIQIVTDSNIINELLKEHYDDSTLLLNRFFFQDFIPLVKHYRFLGVLGLLKRGGISVGKIKLI
ncbi:hypothetical protein BG95_00180 [Thermosipho sp. 1063]|nr:hypothetical protein Y592_00180 [Thermosipho sp. 1070]APT72981.1 hypothetical protein BG95_00180 [Thermosipho sp. 1063]OOC46070.1 hypothetical protein XO08_00185 [Thermosipho sp. 1074]